MNRQYSFDCLDLDDDQTANHHVHPQSPSDTTVAIRQRHSDLPREHNSPILQIVSQAVRVNGFQKSWSKRSVDTERRINDLARNQIMLRGRFGHFGPVAMNEGFTIRPYG